MNLQALERRVYRVTGYVDSPAADVVTRIRMFINEWHRRLLTMPGMEQLRDDTITFSSVANSARYALPQVVSRVKKLSETTNDRTLEMRTLDWYRTVDPDPATGTPFVWVPLGLKPVARQPATTGVWVASSSASDTTQTADIIGIRAGGYLHEPSVVTLNGLTRVPLGALTDYIEVVEFNISAAAVGTVSLYDALAGGNELARIAINQTAAQYVTILLYPTPSAAVTYNLDYVRNILDLSRASDVPLLPEDYHDILSLGAIYEELLRKDDARWREQYRMLENRKVELFQHLFNPPDYLPVPGQTFGPLTVGSNLGPWYPAGRW